MLVTLMTWVPVGTCMNIRSYETIIYIFLILGIPWGLVWTGSRGEGSGWGDHQTVWGTVLQELRLLQNPGPSHQQRFPHGVHYSIERGELLMEYIQFFLKLYSRKNLYVNKLKNINNVQNQNIQQNSAMHYR